MFCFSFTFYTRSIGWVEVSWDNGCINSYRMGAEGKYDLVIIGQGKNSADTPSSTVTSSANTTTTTATPDDNMITSTPTATATVSSMHTI